MTSPRPAAWRLLVPAGLIELALLATLGWWPGASGTWLRLLVFLLAFGVYVFAAGRILGTDGGHVLVWVFGVAMRVVLLPLTPVLSNDVYRQLWDGHVKRAGFNPYRLVPSAAEFTDLHTAYYALIPDPGARSVHPPLAQLAFLLVAVAGGALVQIKLLWLGFDLGTGWLLGRVSRITGRSRRLTQLLYLWSPLLIVEVAWSAHPEPLGLFALALVVLLARAPLGAGAAAAAAALTRLAPLAALPALGRRLGRRFLLGFAGLAVLATLPYLTAPAAALSALRGPVLDPGWSFMSGPFTLLEAVLPGVAAPRIVALAIVVAVAGWATAAKLRPERSFYWILGAALLVTPALRPWYVLWMLPFAALRASQAWVALTGLVFLGYYGLDAYQSTGSWPQPGWLRIVVWLPFLALLARDAARVWRERVPLPKPLSEPR